MTPLRAADGRPTGITLHRWPFSADIAHTKAITRADPTAPRGQPTALRTASVPHPYRCVEAQIGELLIVPRPQY